MAIDERVRVRIRMRCDNAKGDTHRGEGSSLLIINNKKSHISKAILLIFQSCNPQSFHPMCSLVSVRYRQVANNILKHSGFR